MKTYQMETQIWIGWWMEAKDDGWRTRKWKERESEYAFHDSDASLT